MITCKQSVGWNHLSIPKLQQFNFNFNNQHNKMTPLIIVYYYQYIDAEWRIYASVDYIIFIYIIIVACSVLNLYLSSVSLVLIGHLGIHFGRITIELQFFWKEMNWKMSYGKWRLFVWAQMSLITTTANALLCAFDGDPPLNFLYALWLDIPYKWHISGDL